MLISDLNYKTLTNYLKGQGLAFQVGPFSVSLRSTLPAVVRHVEKLYPRSVLLGDDCFIDFHVSVNRVAGLRYWVRPQVMFSFDGFEPFKPLPLAQGAALFEWGLNWCIASSSHQFLIIHSAVIEKNGHGLILPGTPGSGKSTLCAALIHRGWRLLSDEMALLSLTDGLTYPIPRPVSLKNQSIDIIKEFAPQTVFGERVVATTKGDIEHLLAPAEGVLDQSSGIQAKYLVFPHYKSGSDAELIPLAKARANISLIENSFNFNILGDEGFTAIGDLVSRLECYDFTYPDLSQAIDGIDQITSQQNKKIG